MTPTPTLADYRDRAVATLVPFFAEGPGGQAKNARGIAESALDDYRAVTPKELQLAAQIIALGWTSLACLSAAMVVRDTSIDAMLDLQGKALKFNVAKEKSSKALDASRKQRGKDPKVMTADATKWDEGAFQLAINQALEVYLSAAGKLTACLAAAPAVKKPNSVKLAIGHAEPMTPYVLARRAQP